ncbi:MAG: tyrosine-type recombinase/integrase [Prochloraceae cyanobacterium]|nr:tyrosine-type recombinase/integrase [Prochloraceae cyanobacterium]
MSVFAFLIPLVHSSVSNSSNTDSNSVLAAVSLESLAQSASRDILDELLRDKKSPNTRRTYAKSIADFFRAITNDPKIVPSVALIREFLSLNHYNATALVLKYKSILVERNLSPASINLRLSAIKSLVRYAKKIGKCSFTLEEIESIKVVPYRDTTGVSTEVFLRIIKAIDTTTLKGKRDYAIFRLLWDNALRRNEISLADLKDFDEIEGKLWIWGKGKIQLEAVDLSEVTIEAICDWLKMRGNVSELLPLFCTLDRATRGHRLSGNAIYNIVRKTAERAGVKKVLSPHRVRHSSITAALDATRGNARAVQKLSRHADFNTLIRYDDNRRQHQKEVTNILADLI